MSDFIANVFLHCALFGCIKLSLSALFQSYLYYLKVDAVPHNSPRTITCKWVLLCRTIYVYGENLALQASNIFECEIGTSDAIVPIVMLPFMTSYSTEVIFRYHSIGRVDNAIAVDNATVATHGSVLMCNNIRTKLTLQ